jgi:hypothetical protein
MPTLPFNILTGIQAAIGNIFETTAQVFPYTVCFIEESYVHEDGILHVPIAPLPGGFASVVTGTSGPLPAIKSRQDITTLPPTAQAVATSEVINTSAPFMKRVVNFTVARKAAYPKLPAPTPKDGEVRLGYTLSPCTPIYSTAGAPVFTCSGKYEFALLNPRTASDGFPIGRNPATNLANQAIGPGNFDVTLL